MQAASLSTAEPASAPSARRRSVEPALAPRASTESRLLASASRSPAAMTMRASKPIAARTNVAAGRAWRSTSAGSATRVSELAGIACLLGGADDVVDRGAHARGDRGGDGALHERRVGELDVAVGLALQQVTDGEDRGAEVAEDDDAVAGPARAGDRVAHAVLVRAQPTAGQTTRGLDGHIGARHLRGQLGEAA